jgi:hypothetical protein
MAHGLLNQTPQQYYNGNSFGGYQFISLEDIMNNFTATYVGEGKLLEKTLRSDISFHAHRALQELSFDTLKSCKSQEIEIPANLSMVLPHDYVNYVKLTWSDSSGIEHIIYPTSKTSNPKPIIQDDDGNYGLTAIGTVQLGSESVELDGEYSNITVGMQVFGPSIPLNGTNNPNTINAGFVPITVVGTMSNDGGITTITLESETGANVEATWGTGLSTNSQETLTFYPTYSAMNQLLQPIDNVIVLQEASSHIVEGFSWTSTEFKIKASSESSISSIEVGMIATHEDFTHAGRAVVVDINGVYITIDKPLQDTQTAVDVTFIDYSKISDTLSNYNSATPSENQDDYQDDTYWPAEGSRFGLDPQHAQANGSYYIDCDEGIIHFSSNLSGKTVILKYISDGLGTDEEMVVPKLAEEAMYKWIIYGCISARIDIPEYVIRRFKKEKFAETRKAKIRLSNIKLEEITQILRGKSKQIKH